jgi:hypothetical protein
MHLIINFIHHNEAGMKACCFYEEVSLVVCGLKILVSKDLLIKSSPVFKAMFRSGMSEAVTNELSIFDFQICTVETFVLILNQKHSAGCLSVEILGPTEAILDLLAFSMKYDVSSVVEIATTFLSTRFTVENVFLFLKYSDFHSCEALRKASIDFIVSNFSNISLTLLKKSCSFEVLNEIDNKRNDKILLKLKEFDSKSSVYDYDLKSRLNTLEIKMNAMYNFYGLNDYNHNENSIYDENKSKIYRVLF